MDLIDFILSSVCIPGWLVLVIGIATVTGVRSRLRAVEEMWLARYHTLRVNKESEIEQLLNYIREGDFKSTEEVMNIEDSSLNLICPQCGYMNQIEPSRHLEESVPCQQCSYVIDLHD